MHFFSTGLILIIIKISSFNLWYLHVDFKQCIVCIIVHFIFLKKQTKITKTNIGIIDLCSSVKKITVSFFTIVLCIEITFQYFNMYITIKEL